jgi:predicted lipid carrier protein YhbT
LEVRGQELEISEKLERIFWKLSQLPLRLLPLWIEALGASIFFTLFLEGNPLFKEKIKELGDKVFLFEVKDIQKSFYLIIAEGETRLLPYFKGKPDVIMTGDAPILFGLLLNRIDPDTIFFTRQLMISGDTAVAVHFKNILNSL